MKVLLVSEGKHEALGALETLVRRLSPKLSCTWRRVSDVKLATLHGKGRGFFKRALRFMIDAQKEGFDGLVFVIDEDNRAERIRELDDAQDSTAIGIRRALGCAVHTFDAWFLADEQALSTVLGSVIPKQPHPEGSADAKAACRSLIEDSGSDLAQSDFYAKVAEVLDLDCLVARCPKGFAVFASRVRALGVKGSV